MKKSTIKLIAMLLTVVLMLPNFAGAGALNENEVDDSLLTWEEVEEIGRLESPATTAYEAILNSWTNESNIIIYPDTYGGSYLREDYKLVVNLVNGDPALRESIISAVKNPDVLVFENVSLSRHDLYELADESDTLSGMTVLYKSVSYKSNSVEIGVSKSNMDTLIIALPLIAKPNVSYNLADDLVQQVACQPGSPFNIGSTEDHGSMGWHGKYKFGSSEYDCILTAGHVVTAAIDSKSNLSIPGTTIISLDNLKKSSYCYNSLDHSVGTTKYGDPIYNGDYAFVRTTAVTKSNAVLWNNSSIAVTFAKTAVNYELLENSTLFKGDGVSGASMGTIEHVYTESMTPTGNYNYTINNAITVLPKIEGSHNRAFSIPGDSGCTVFYYKNNVPYVAGIVICGPENLAASSSISAICNVNAILNSGFNPY